METTKKLLCLKVDELKVPERSNRDYFPMLTHLPKLCSVFLTKPLIDDINRAKSIISESNLLEVSLCVDYVNWFTALDKQIYQLVKSQLHVRSNYVYFSGSFAPKAQPDFQTAWLPISCLSLELHLVSKTVNMALLVSPVAKAAISEIEYLDKEREVATDRQESLEQIDTAVKNLEPASALSNDSITDSVIQSLFIELKLLEKHIDELDYKIEQSCLALCKNALDIGIGDRLFWQMGYKNKYREIVVESVSYYDGTIYIEGPKVLQKNVIGKRNETVCIELLTKDERH